MTFSLVVLTALVQPAAEPATYSGMPPKQVLARIDARGSLTIHSVTVTHGPASQEMPLRGQEKEGDEKAPATVKVTVTTRMVTTVELPAKHVQAYTTDGRSISPQRLATLLAKERSVLVATDGKKVDPFLLELYKEDTIILVPPANVLNGGGPWGVPPAYSEPVPALPPLPGIKRDS
jgi:hypothetical protein